MCTRIQCSRCGKPTWVGCGRHVEQAMAGIPPEKRDAVFQPFVRGDTTRGDGIGLGLSLVQRICQRQGWRIRLDGHQDGGCEFRVDFFPV